MPLPRINRRHAHDTDLHRKLYRKKTKQPCLHLTAWTIFMVHIIKATCMYAHFSVWHCCRMWGIVVLLLFYTPRPMHAAGLMTCA